MCAAHVLPAVTCARPPRDNSPKSHEHILARMLEYVALAGGLDAALTDDLAREEVGVLRF